jgi:hypothetical protein
VGLALGGGFTVVTGGPGTGKTVVAAAIVRDKQDAAAAGMQIQCPSCRRPLTIPAESHAAPQIAAAAPAAGVGRLAALGRLQSTPQPGQSPGAGCR